MPHRYRYVQKCTYSYELGNTLDDIHERICNDTLVKAVHQTSGSYKPSYAAEILTHNSHKVIVTIRVRKPLMERVFVKSGLIIYSCVAQ